MEINHDDVEHIMESDEEDHVHYESESIVKPKKKRTITPEHLAKMREGRKRYLEEKRNKKLKDTQPQAQSQIEERGDDKPKPRSAPIRKKRMKTVNNYYYQEPIEEESESSTDEEEVENNYYGGSMAMDGVSDMRFV